MTVESPINFLRTAKDDILEELKVLEFDNTVKSSYAPKRVEIWYGYGSNLQSVKDGRSEVEWKRDFPEWLENLRKTYFPESNSALLCRGTKPDSDTSIDWHRDHGNFEKRVVMVNFGHTIFYLQDYVQGTLVYTLKDGDVVEFDSKLLHKSTQITEDRYIITFRKVKKEFTIQKLF
jgi:hypothetical protein